ncbi:MAG: methyltransferase domain-containing protein [Pirellulaceae bacterium]
MTRFGNPEMPIGAYNLIPSLAHQLISRQPRSVLDLGIGFGNHGAMVRQWLDLGVTPFKTTLVGVEAWTNYRSPLWSLYDIVYSMRIEEYLTSTEDLFDCILLCDVIEHFEKADGVGLLRAVANRVATGGCLIVGTPASFFEQGAVYGNELERHRSLWSEEDFQRLGFEVEIVGRASDFGGESIHATWMP